MEQKFNKNKKNNPARKPGERSGGRAPYRVGNDRGRGYEKYSHAPRKLPEQEVEWNENVEATATESDEEENTGLVIGRNAVRELLRSGRAIDKILVRRGELEGSIVALVAEARAAGVPIVEIDKSKLDAMAGFAPHQGIVAMAAEKEYCTVEDILALAEERGEPPLIAIADGITDPYNLGALIRCAEGVGAHGLIIPKRRAVGLTPLVSKASAGAIEHLPIAKVSNIASTVTLLKKKGVWIYAAEAGGTPYYDVDFTGPAAIIFGSEGNGVSALNKQNSDVIVSIPMFGRVNSFNVSTAAAVLLAEASKQHHVGKNK
jgi:23S rRNA (guanosine2251-2'-O)-methyltransferase